MSGSVSSGSAVSLRLPTLEVAGDTLKLVYEVRNESPHRVFLVNRLPRRSPQGLRIDTNLVYAHLEPGPVLALSKRLITAPEDLDVEVPEVPYLTPLAGGERFAETLRIPLPVRPHDPYRPQPAVDTVVTVDRLAWLLGYVVEDTRLPASEDELASGGRAWRMDFGELNMRQRLETVQVDDVPVPTVISLASVADGG
jgi:hypothetical protein